MLEGVRFKGSPMTLTGRYLAAGNTAPDFRVVSQELKEITLADFESKIKVITSFPSLDTPVCDLQVKEFNKRAPELSSDVVVLGISKDLPFAQKRFCSSNDIKSINLLSDYKYSSFGINYGLLVKELNLLARSILILDKNNILRYKQVSQELTNPPDYADALKILKNIVDAPALAAKAGLPGKCKPCEGKAPALAKETIEELSAGLRGWALIEGKKIAREFRFRDFIDAKYFLDLVSVIAQEQGHHPAMALNYNKLKITLSTHAAGGLTENDFIMAGIIDRLGL